jgi:capsular exopolysaccharide synthesis family protein
MDHQVAPFEQYGSRPGFSGATPAGSSLPGAGGGDLMGIFRRHLWIVAGSTFICLAAAIAYVLLVRPSYTASASVRIDDRRQGSTTSDLLGLGGPNEVGTEVEMIRSRTLAGDVVDSLGLQLELRSPRRALRNHVFSVVHVDRDADPGAYTLRPVGAERGRAASGFVLTNDSTKQVVGRVEPGVPAQFAGVTLQLRRRALELGTIRFTVSGFDDAVLGLQQALAVDLRSHEANVVDVTYTGTDPALVQAVPNLLLQRFIDDRQIRQHSVGRGVAAFLREQTAKLAGQLTSAEDTLRRFREAAHVVSLPDQAHAGVSEIAGLQAERNGLDAERKALARLLGSVDASPDSGLLTPIAFPTLLRNQVASALLGSLAEAQNRRDELLTRRSPEDEDVRLATQRVQDLRAQLKGIAATYLQGLTDQLGAIDTTLQQSTAQLATLPAKEIRLAQLERNVSNLSQIYTLVQSRLKEAEIAEAADDPSVRLVDSAPLPREPVSPRKGLSLALALVAGLMLGMFGAVVREYVDRAVHTRFDIQAASGGLPVLGTIPHGESGNGNRRLPDLVYKRHRDSDGGAQDAHVFAPGSQEELSEAFMRLATNLSHTRPDRPPKVMLVASALPGEGKTTSAVNLALTRAWRGGRVLLVDADLRRGTVHSLFKLPIEPGLSEVLAGATPAAAAVRRVDIGSGHSLSVLTSGSPVRHASHLLGIADLPKLFAALRNDYDAIVVDSSPINVVSDTTLVAPHCDGVIVVVRAGVTVPDVLDYTLEQLRHIRVSVLGMVLNDIDQRRDAAYREAYQYHDRYLAARGA